MAHLGATPLYIKELPLGVPCRKLVLQLKGVVELAAQAKAVEVRTIVMLRVI
jgi:hypothetical protein